jgi:Ser/Thr protein kinase RdoA (MazF antagonist)
VTGLIDFGDAHFSLRIFDVATALLYIIMDVDVEDYRLEWPLIVRDFLKGYGSQRTIRDLQICRISMYASLKNVYGIQTLGVLDFWPRLFMG